MNKKLSFLIIATLISLTISGVAFGNDQLGGTIPVLPPFRVISGVITPRDTGWVLSIGGSSTVPGEVRFLELLGGGTNYVGFEAPDAVSANIIWELPATDSTGTQYLKSDGSKTLSWGDPGGAGASTALDNLASVAINTSLISDTDSTDDLGSSSKYWANAYIDKVYFYSTTHWINSSTWKNAAGVIFDTPLIRVGISTPTIYIKGGSGYGVYSNVDSDSDLGTSSYYWANAYIDKIYLDADSTIEAADVDAWLTTVAYGDLTGNPSDVITAGTLISWSTDTLNVDNDLHNYSWTNVVDADIPNAITVTAYMEDEDINTFSELQSWVTDETLLKAGTLTDTKYCIYDSASTDIICDSTPAGSGDVESVGNCLTGACLDGTSDGGTNITFYNIDSNKTQLIASDTASDLVITLPATTGTLVHSGVATLSSLTSIGTIGTGVWQGTAIDISSYTNLTAGRSLTMSADSVIADAELYTDKHKIAFEDPVATDDFFFGEVHKAQTFVSIYCKTLVGTVDLDVQIAGADIHGSDITCDTSGVLQEGLGGDTAGAVGEEIKLAITSVASSPTYLMVQLNFTYND